MVFLDFEADQFGEISEVAIIDTESQICFFSKLRTSRGIGCSGLEFNDVYDVIFHLLDGKCVVAFDARNDELFLYRTLELYGLKPPAIAWLCFKGYAEDKLNVKDLSLKKLSRLLRLKYPNHTAERDCLVLVSAYNKINKL